MNFRVYYRIRPSFREEDFPHTQKQFEQKYRFIKNVEAESKEQIYTMMQAENWSPNGEAKDVIRSLKLYHTSMSVGDIVVDENNKHYVVQDAGFKWIPVEPNRVMRRILGITTSRDTTREGHPRDYWYILECGHVALESHKARTAIEYGLASEHIAEVPLMKNCKYCQSHKPVDKETFMNVFGFFRAMEVSDDLIDIYKKIKNS